MEIINLNKDVHYYLMSFVDIRSIYIFSSTSKTIYDFFNNEYWEHKYKLDFPLIQNDNWKQAYKNQYTQIFTKGLKITSFHDFTQIECKDNMIMAVDRENNLYSWLHSRQHKDEDKGIMEYLKTPTLLLTGIKKVYNFRYSIAYIDMDDKLWWAPSNDKYPRPNEYTFKKISDIKVKDFTVNYDNYFIIDLDDYIWKGSRYDPLNNINLVKLGSKAKNFLTYESYICIIDLKHHLYLMKGEKNMEALYKHDIEILDVLLDYEYTVFLDKNNDVWVFIHNKNIRKKIPTKAKSISLNAIIDLNDNVWTFDENFNEQTSLIKVPYIKGVKIASFWGNSVIMGAKTIHK